MDGPALPLLDAPHDAMRHGLASLKQDAAVKHPVEAIQLQSKQQASISQHQMLRDVYGLAFPARMQIERQILTKFTRLPGLPSSLLGLEALTGELDEFGFESYLGLPGDSEVAPPDMHSVMETRLKLASGTKPMSRGLY